MEHINALSWQQKFMVLSPIVLFLFCSFLIMVRLKKENYRLSDALSENDVGKSPSTSRLIIFMSGTATVLVGISSVSYFFYMYFRTSKEPSFEKLYNILLALGFGVVPYTINKVTDIFKK